MKQTTQQMIGCALALAALFSTGCHLRIVPAAGLVGNPSITAKQETGSVKVAFQGQSAYKTLSSPINVDHVKLTLQSERGKAQERVVSLNNAGPGVEFKKVATGKATLSVVAYDARNQVVGKGSNGAFVGAQETVFIHVAVKLLAAGGSGNVNALITFEEDLTAEAVFYQEDQDRDGHLNETEYRNAHHRLGWSTVRPQPMPMPVPADGKPPYMMNCIPPQHDDLVRAAFLLRDLDGNGRLSLQEFLGATITYPVDDKAVPPTAILHGQD